MRAAGGASFPDTSRPSTWTGKSSPPSDGAALIGADVGPARLCPSPAPSLPVLVRAPHCLAQLLATGGNPWQPRVRSALLSQGRLTALFFALLCAFSNLSISPRKEPSGVFSAITSFRQSLPSGTSRRSFPFLVAAGEVAFRQGCTQAVEPTHAWGRGNPKCAGSCRGMTLRWWQQLQGGAHGPPAAGELPPSTALWAGGRFLVLVPAWAGGWALGRGLGSGGR